MVIRLHGMAESGREAWEKRSRARGGPSVGMSRQAEIIWLSAWMGGKGALDAVPFCFQYSFSKQQLQKKNKKKNSHRRSS